jgi:N-acetylglucosaminyl-diphospho-decaprenol L-rhamnosyltransferase
MSNSAEPARTLGNSGASASVVVVTFNSRSTLDTCLTSIPPAVEVIIVDQNSSDDTISVAHQVRPDAKIIRAGANRGFGAGCNLGAANATGSVLVFLNPDASLGRDSLRILTEAVVNENALVGPTILDSTGNAQTRARNWSNILMDLASVFWPHKFAVGVLARDIGPDHEVYRIGGEVPYVQGSCMAVSAENFWQAGGFDERYFLYYEEESLARSLASIGVSVCLEPRAVVTHIGKVSTSQSPLFAVGQQYRSKAIYYSTYLSRPSAFLFVHAMWMLLRIMAIATPVRRVVGLRPSQDRMWYHSAAEGVISGWKGRIVNPPGEAADAERGV